MKNNRKKVHRKWLLGNRDGSTLMLVVISLMLVSIAIIAFQTAVVSFTTRTLTQHYEKQAYLSARSVAQAIVDKIEEDSISMESGGSADLSTLLEDLYSLDEGDSIELENISFAGLTEDGVDLDTGVVEAYIHRVDATTYVVEAIANVNGDTDSVEIALDGTAISAGGGQVEIVGNWDGFYSDFGIGIETGYQHTLNDAYSSIVFGTTTFISGTSLEANEFRGDVFTDNDIIFKYVDYQNGTLKSEGSVTFLDGINVSSATIQSSETITFAGQSSVSAATYSKELVITGDNSTFSTGPYVAETVIIDADDITMYGTIICENLEIKGNNVVFVTITADNVTLDATSFAGHITAQSIEVTADATGEYGSFSTTTGTITIGGTSTNSTASIFGWGGTVGTASSFTPFYSSTYGDTITALDTDTIVYRTVPEWAVGYSSNTFSAYDGSSSETLTAGYYTIDTSSENFSTHTTTYEGTEDSTEVVWTDVDLTVTSSSGGDVYIVIKSGQNICASLDVQDTYFILEGNAKLKIAYASTGGNAKYRVYGDAVSQSTYDGIQDEIAYLVAATELEVGGNVSSINYVAMQESITDIIEGYWNDMSMLIYEDGVYMVEGSVVVPYIKYEGKGVTLNEVSYNSAIDDDYASDSSNGVSIGSSFMSFDFDAYVN